jgi:hypothetical protein
MTVLRKSLAIAGALMVTGLAACGGGGGPTGAAPPVSAPTPAPTPASLGPVDPTLVGTWTGSIGGSLGPASYTITLNADATMSALGTGGYCRLAGSWGVAAGQFAARGEECQGFAVSYAAPASASRLMGTWTASGGARGQFDVSR